MTEGMQVGNVITLPYPPFGDAFYKVVGTDSTGGILLEGYFDQACTRRRPLADGRLIPPKDTV